MPTQVYHSRRPDAETSALVVDRTYVQLTMDLLRAAPRRLCFHCGRPLERGTCAVCDRP